MVMTNEERAKLVAALLNPEHDRFPLRTARDAAKEIEILVKRVEQLEALPPDNARWAIHDNNWTFK